MKNLRVKRVGGVIFIGCILPLAHFSPSLLMIFITSVSLFFLWSFYPSSHMQRHTELMFFYFFPCVSSSHSPFSSFTSSPARPLLVLVCFLLSSAVSGRCGVFMGSIPLCCCCCCCRAYVIHSNVPKQHRARWRENEREERKEGWKRG